MHRYCRFKSALQYLCITWKDLHSKRLHVFSVSLSHWSNLMVGVRALRVSAESPRRARFVFIMKRELIIRKSAMLKSFVRCCRIFACLGKACFHFDADAGAGGQKLSPSVAARG